MRDIALKLGNGWRLESVQGHARNIHIMSSSSEFSNRNKERILETKGKVVFVIKSQ